jgi:SET domain-containing protein
MLLVKTKLAASPIHGMGLFAEEFIPKGTVVWKFVPGFDVEITPEAVEEYPEHVRKWMTHFAYLDMYLKRWIMCSDDARFVNHADDPNMLPDYSSDPYGPDIACRDIQPGEEITDNYTHFEDAPAP